MIEMSLSPEQLATYEAQGYLLLPRLFADPAVDAMVEELSEIVAVDAPTRVVEKDGVTVRSVYGTHTQSEAFRRLAHDPVLVRAARAMLGGDVYVYQFKVNVKEAGAGDVWEWHQDFAYWKLEDGLPRPDAMTIAVFLDEMTAYNGPLMVIPGSHRHGLLEAVQPAIPATKDRRLPYGGEPDWIENLVADIKYALPKPKLRELADAGGITVAQGARGSALVFHPNIVHGSAQNISPYSRRLALVTYCRTDNVPPPPGSRRPEFLCSTDRRPIKALDE
jgi:ectoine hydroxylase